MLNYQENEGQFYPRRCYRWWFKSWPERTGRHHLHDIKKIVHKGRYERKDLEDTLLELACRVFMCNTHTHTRFIPRCILKTNMVTWMKAYIPLMTELWVVQEQARRNLKAMPEDFQEHS